MTKHRHTVQAERVLAATRARLAVAQREKEAADKALAAAEEAVRAADYELTLQRRLDAEREK